MKNVTVHHADAHPCKSPFTNKRYETLRICYEWTEEEDRLVREHHADRRYLESLLPHRTLIAIKSRVKNLQLNPKEQKFILTVLDEKRIKQLSQICSTYQAVADRIDKPEHAIAIRSHMRRRKMNLFRPAPKLTGHPLFDEVRQQIWRIKMNMRDFDRSLGYRAYYFSGGRPHKVTLGQIDKAVKALGGRFVIVWDDEHEDAL